MKLQLPDVTCIIVDCVNIERAIRVLERCKSLCDFGSVKLLTSIPNDYEYSIEIMPLNSLIAYSVFMLTEFSKYIDTSHCLTVQRDGWVLNPDSFDFEWLKLDWISPIFMQYNKVGSGGFSLRSKMLMDYSTSIMPKWDGTQEHADKIQSSLNYYEDGVICLSGKFNQFKFATLEQAANFANGGNRDPKYFVDRPFGFHRTFSAINFETGMVDSLDLTKDIHVSYDSEIDSL